MDADGYWPPIPRFNNGLWLDLDESISQSSLEMPPTNTLGENEGADAIAIISPLVTSIAIAHPPKQSGFPCSCKRFIVDESESSAAFCISASRVSTTSEPLWASTLLL